MIMREKFAAIITVLSCCLHLTSAGLDVVDEAAHIKFPGVQMPRFDGYPVGHKEKLGMQRPSLGQIPEYFDILGPKELWDKHVKTYRPAVLRGALKPSPALENWTDEYMTEHYGDQEVLVEKKFEDRKSEPKRMRIAAFLKEYKLHNWYVVSMMPDVMRKELRVPKPLVCSTFRENLQELNLWIGTHGTRSVLHFDADNIMHCLVAGRKDWILIHPDYKPNIDMVLGERGQGSGFSHLKVDEIDLTLHPEVAKMPWEHVTLYGGDCLYLPPQYLHQVRSYNRSISATYLFYPRDSFDDSDCKDIDLDEYLGLDQVYVAWTYVKDQETVDMGYQNPVNVYKTFVHKLDITGTTWMTFKQFLVFQLATQGGDLMQKPKVLTWFTNQVDANGDKNITYDEVKNADMEIWKEWCRQIESPHGPTKSELNVNDQKTNKSPDFNPRNNDYFVDAKDTLRFLKEVIKRIGKNGTLSFPMFRRNVLLGQGSHTEAFVFLDWNMNGFISIKELDNLDLKHIRDFQKTVSSYMLKDSNLHGGGNFEEDFRDDKKDEEEEREMRQYILEYLTEMRDSIKKSDGAKWTYDQFRDYFDEEPFPDADYLFVKNFFFHVMDKNHKGFIAAEDLDIYLEDSEREMTNPINPDDAPVVRKDRTTFAPPRQLLTNLISVANNLEDYTQRAKKIIKRKGKKDEEEEETSDEEESDDEDEEQEKNDDQHNKQKDEL